MKPTYGRCSRWGIVAFASSLDQAGPMTKTVRDAAIMLGDHGRRGRERFHQRRSAGARLRKAAGRRHQGPEGRHSQGIPHRRHAAEINALWTKGAEWLKAQGAEIKEVSLPHTKYALPTYYIVAPAECSSNLARYDGVRFGLRASGPAIWIDLYEKSRGEGFGAEVQRRILIGTYVLSAGYYDAYYSRAQKLRTHDQARLRPGVSRKCDVLLTPTTPGPAFAVGAKTTDPLEMYLQDVFTVTVNLAGLPGISVPAGLTPVACRWDCS
jgi:aspartyl-tRNA(Asn)/glutamyl-tRNA(Gln) amidotransferase subunit A